LSYNAPTREQITQWASDIAPNLQVQHRRGGSRARFTFDGVPFEIEVEGDSAGEDIYVKIWESIREAQGTPIRRPIKELDESVSLKAQIVAARKLGNDWVAEQLTMELARLCGDAARIRMQRGRPAPPDGAPRRPFLGFDRRRVY
jgi:hypothetical protein